MTNDESRPYKDTGCVMDLIVSVKNTKLLISSLEIIEQSDWVSMTKYAYRVH